MPRGQLNLRWSSPLELAKLRKKATALGYSENEFSMFVRDACRLFGGLTELEDAGKQEAFDAMALTLREITAPLEAEIEQLKRALKRAGGEV